MIPTTLTWLADFLRATLAAGECVHVGLGCPTATGGFRRWHTSPAEIRALGGDTSALVNYYFCCSVLDGRGHKAEHAVRTQAIFADLDYGAEGHRKPSPFPDRDAALAHLRAMPLPPAAIWDTGHGLQACWLLDAPVEYADQAAADQLDQVRAVIYAAVKSDSTSSRVNLFRVPGSVNDKSREHGCPPALGQLIQDLDPSRRHSLDALRAAFEPLASARPAKTARKTTAPRTKKVKATTDYAGSIADPAALEIPDWLREQLDDLHEGDDRSAVFFAAVMALADLDATLECIEQVLAPLPWVPQRYIDEGRLQVEIWRCLTKREDDLDNMVLDLPPPCPVVKVEIESLVSQKRWRPSLW